MIKLENLLEQFLKSKLSINHDVQSRLNIKIKKFYFKDFNKLMEFAKNPTDT